VYADQEEGSRVGSTHERLEIAWNSLVVEGDFRGPLHLLFNLCSGQFFEAWR
jgi:hypothetical protein